VPLCDESTGVEVDRRAFHTGSADIYPERCHGLGLLDDRLDGVSIFCSMLERRRVHRQDDSARKFRETSRDGVDARWKIGMMGNAAGREDESSGRIS
jgi:hypothetical protein